MTSEYLDNSLSVEEFGGTVLLIDTLTSGDYYTVHYAGSDIFTEPYKIACISVLHSKTGKTVTFSRNKYSETKLLKEFFNHISELPGPFITWNWKDSTYGLPAITKRYEELTKTEMKIDRSKFYDLDALFKEKYSRKYIDHPKLQKLAEKNELNMIGFQSGEKEPLLFDAKNFRAIEVSCNLKAGLIHRLVQLSRANELKVDTPDGIKPSIGEFFRKYSNFLTKYKSYRRYIGFGGFISIFGIIAGILQDALPLEFLDVFGNAIRWSLTILLLVLVGIIIVMEILCNYYRIKD
ncbi:MAG: hypothetical protein ACFFD4_38340 [Candidatus Odinarchaeota archaeon]